VSRRLLAFALTVIGIALMAWVVVQRVERARFQHEKAAELRESVSEARPGPAPAAEPRLPPDGVIGRLEIPRLHLSVVVMEGDDEETLEKAVGHLPDTVLPWERGNTALAGHRDGFFRPLEDIEIGDEMRLTSPRGVFTYRVHAAFITMPTDVNVLNPSWGDELTLITCYPFHYVGSAPKRYVIKADRVVED
jgi:sortase A